MRTVTRQTIHQARRLAKQADQSERQAEAYNAIAGAIELLDIDPEIQREEVYRMNKMAEEFYDDADDRRGRIDPGLIDQL